MLIYRLELSKFSISEISINMGKKINVVAFNKVTKIKEKIIHFELVNKNPACCPFYNNNKNDPPLI